MGLDTTCVATYKRQRSEGRALLETDHVLFRGDFRVKVPFSSITSIKASRGTLTLGTADGALALQLGAGRREMGGETLVAEEPRRETRREAGLARRDRRHR